jgi:hypothetical protein
VFLASIQAVRLSVLIRTSRNGSRSSASRHAYAAPDLSLKLLLASAAKNVPHQFFSRSPRVGGAVLYCADGVTPKGS